MKLFRFIKRQKLRKTLQYGFLTLLLVIIFSMSRSTFELLGRDDAIEQARQGVERLKQEQAELLELKEEVESDKFVEQEAREKLGLAKEGEIVVVLPDEEILRRLAPPLEEEYFLESTPIYKRWIELFF